MKFSAATVSVLSLVAASFTYGSPVAEPVQLSPRIPDPGECVSLFKYTRGFYHGSFAVNGCVNLVESCRFTVGGANRTDIWSVQSCVAAATCQGVVPLVQMVQCTPGGENVPDPQNTASLDYTNIYAPIVGDCAWAQGGCPITQQNYIDFFYGALTAINTNAWPSDSSGVITNWNYITAWAATGATVPYLNFNDWLHYSNSE